MTVSQRPRRASSGSPVWRALGLPARALRHLHNEQMLMWEGFWRSCRAPQPRTQAPAGGTGARTPAGVGAVNRAA